METLRQDVRGGIRLLLKHRWLTAVAILMLAIGVGMNAAIFSVASAVLLRPLAIAAPDRLMVLWERDAEQPVLEVSLANFLDWRFRAPRLAAAAGARQASLDLRARAATRPETSAGKRSSAWWPTSAIASWSGRGSTSIFRTANRPSASATSSSARRPIRAG